jgi:DNA-binding response OmpR family regulator
MRPRVLVVEDSPVLVRPLIRLLARNGYDVHHVDSCAGARALQERFDAGVFDVELPDGLGTDLCSELLARKSVCRAVFYTGVANEGLLKRALELAPVVRKSEDIALLLQAICPSIDASEQQGSGRRRVCSDRSRS